MSPERRPRLVRRVAWLSAVAAACGGTLAAGVAAFVSSELVERHGDANVREELYELASEIIEELHDSDDDDDWDLVYGPDGRPTLESVLAHELKDVRMRGATARLVLRSGRSIGDDAVPLIEPGACGPVPGPGPARRVCAVPFNEADGDRLLLAVDAEDRELSMLFAWALAIGVLAGAAAGGLASLQSARWTLSPLTELRDRVRRVNPSQPRADILDPPLRHDELEELRTAVVELVERLGASLAQARSFAAQAAHELRTPLTILSGELELMAENEDLDRPALERVRGRLSSVVELVERLLVLAGPENQSVGGEPVDLADVAARVIELLPSAERVVVEVEPDVVVRGDPGLLRSLLTNAVDNALKFSPGPVQVTIGARADDAWIEVRDTGPGLPLADRERAFEPFFRSAAARASRAPGYGLGLALIGYVARAHGGEASFVDVSKGATLRIRLPRWVA